MELFSVKSGEATVYFGANSIQKLRKYLNKYDLICLVTGRSSAEVSGALSDAVGLLNELDVKYIHFSEIKPNPTDVQVSELAQFIWEHGAEAVLAIGGGSVIDAAKVAAAIVAGGGRVEEYMSGLRKPKRVLPLFAVNLTHGTGTEVDRYAVVTIEEEKAKFGRPIAYPIASVDDPKYLLTLPKSQTIYTTLDAFYHSYESATVKRSKSPYVRLLGRESIGLIRDWLPKALSNLRDIECRYWLLYSSLLAGMAIDHASTHIIHAIEHALSGIQPKLAHGAGLAIIGPRAIYYTHKAMPEESATALRPIAPELKGIPDEAEEAAKAVAEFQRSVGFEERLSDYGFGRDDVKDVIELVLGPLRYLSEETPFPVSEEIIKDIYLSSL